MLFSFSSAASKMSDMEEGELSDHVEFEPEQGTNSIQIVSLDIWLEYYFAVSSTL